jgi:tyrosine-protein kinase Etk/Wzc
MNDAPKNQEKQYGSFVEEVTFKYLPYWPLFAALAVLFALAGWTYLKYTPPYYEITSSLLVTDEKKGADENPTIQQLNLPSTKKIVENELEVMQSRKLMDEVVKDLYLYAPIYMHGKIRATSAYTSSPISVEVAHPESLIPVAKVYFTYNEKERTVSINNTSYPLDKFVSTPFGELKFLPNLNFIKPTTKPLYFQLKSISEVTNYISKQLDISEVGKLSSIVKLKIKDVVPRRGEDILNTLMEKYNKASVDYKNQLAKNTIAFIDERLSTVAGDLKNLEKEIQAYRTSKGVINLGDQSRLYLQNVTQNDQKLADINMQMAVLDQVQKYVSAKDNTAGIVPSTLGVNDAMLSKLLDHLYESQIQYERLKKTTAENNPMLQAIAKQIENIRPSILENIQSQKTSLQASLNNVNTTNKGYNSLLQTIPEKERGLIDVSRQDAIQNATYSFLLQKREQTALTYASNQPDSKIVDQARASVIPVGPKRSIVYLVALGVAAMLTFLFISFKELFTRKILFRKEIEDFSSVRIVGEISNFRRQKNIFLNEDNNMMMEQLRQLRVAIGLFNPQNTNRKILITSSIGGEGKSVISSNLALSLSQSGKRVILLDADIRNPQLSRKFNISKAAGLAEYLENNVEVTELISTLGNPNLFMISAGRTKNNSTELLLNGKIKELMNYLSQSFDYIIVDSSPVSLVTDAYVWSEYCDVTLYVIRHEYTPKTFVKQLDYNNRIRTLKNLSIVFNGIKRRGFVRNDYGYGYGYEPIMKRDKDHSFNQKASETI